jgi:endonuclease/exonuclease/phosphatase family metal-dependent hydrolase
MQTELRIVNWNMAGAKYFALEKESEKEQFRADLNRDLADLIKRQDPHVIALQETVQYALPGEARTSLVAPPPGYAFTECVLIDSERHSYVSKWRKIARKGQWPPGTYFGQGLGTLWRNDVAQFKHFPVWRIPDLATEPDGAAHPEEVILMSGLYFGDRDTEPRAALVTHFVVSHELRNPRIKLSKPLDVFVVNLHLTTLKGEREGIPQIDEEAARIRSHQLDIVLSGIVSRYNAWRSTGYRTSGAPPSGEGEEPDRYSPIWILCGDFNFTQDSLEYHRIQRANFVDVCPVKGLGTKASGFGARARLTVDYIFAGPKFISLDPVIVDDAIKGAATPEYSIKVSDHYPIFAEVPLTPR